MNRLRLVGAFAGAVTTLGFVAPAVATHADPPETAIHGMLVRDANANANANGNANGHGPGGGGGGGVKNLLYHGGAVNLTPKVFIVYWGSQWVKNATDSTPTNDPAGLAPLQREFFSGTDASAWGKSTLQYCSGTSGVTSTNATSCPNPFAGVTGNLVAGTWLDTSTEPRRASQSDLAGEAQRAAVQAAAQGINPTSVQYVIDSPTGNGPSGFGTNYCAWHSSTTYNGALIAYTNMPYVPDAGSSCGAGFVSASGSEDTSANEGVTIVGGHEWAETVTDEYPNGGWLDANGAENGDKCAWISTGSGATGQTSIGGKTYVVQTLWSNAASGCVMTS